MKRLVVLIGLAGCASPPPPDQDFENKEIRERLVDPARVHELFFAWIGSEELYGKAHDKLLTPAAKGSLQYEPFCLGVTQARNLVPEGFRVLVSGMRQHAVKTEGDTATVRWCNPDMGYSRDITLRATKVGRFTLWYVELTREDLESLKDGLLNWYRKQKDAANGQRLVYPPHWKYAPVGACACSRS
jgi:hypothetical protein